MEIKAKINKWDLIKLQLVLPFVQLGNYKQGEKTAFRWEKTIANEATDN